LRSAAPRDSARITIAPRFWLEEAPCRGTACAPCRAEVQLPVRVSPVPTPHCMNSGGDRAERHRAQGQRVHHFPGGQLPVRPVLEPIRHGVNSSGERIKGHRAEGQRTHRDLPRFVSRTGAPGADPAPHEQRRRADRGAPCREIWCASCFTEVQVRSGSRWRRPRTAGTAAASGSRSTAPRDSVLITFLPTFNSRSGSRWSRTCAV